MRAGSPFTVKLTKNSAYIPLRRGRRINSAHVRGTQGIYFHLDYGRNSRGFPWENAQDRKEMWKEEGLDALMDAVNAAATLETE
mgnify:CR=1 FL=1